MSRLLVNMTHLSNVPSAARELHSPSRGRQPIEIEMSPPISLREPQKAAIPYRVPANMKELWETDLETVMLEFRKYFVLLTCRNVHAPNVGVSYSALNTAKVSDLAVQRPPCRIRSHETQQRISRLTEVRHLTGSNLNRDQIQNGYKGITGPRKLVRMYPRDTIRGHILSKLLRAQPIFAGPICNDVITVG